MKIRNGFISNSSTTSFCIYGIQTKKDIDNSIIRKNGLEIYESNPNIYDYYNSIGISWSSIKDDETGLQFKQRIEKILKELGFDEECCTYKEAWFDG